jgi:hypothetical protein
MNKSSYAWNESLDALIAAPEHHKLLFENNHVRVLDTLIMPGEITKIHTHCYPATLYILSWSDFIRYDADGNVMVDSRNMSSPPLPNTSLWTEPLIPHSLKNIGNQKLHVISVEIKNVGIEQ